ncbi:non-homologous end joining protein Ku [Youhaiella tibetensis]|uniref:Non-homologous end joining protein Ku n=1 Tax=Paradevosia tibetensis TaxID=1447062 RepID=A0A5B9DSV8_9HYPH|nr:Ku protein [Youhaiella tibetensis]QEE22025.1 Ku protein [Youhaiella tibetensis]GGF46035.1 non-homologous end joining protein Ku [Youhaiella tibetensis]
MPASRPVWKGQLRLSLVSIAVELYAATKANAKPSFRQIHEPTGKPIHYEKVVAGVGPVDKDEIMKGFEYEKGDYVLLTDKEIDAVKLETRKTLELTQFVGVCDIDPIYYDKPYFVVPADDLAEDAFRVLRDALRESQKIGIGQLALRGKEYLVAIRPSGTGLLLETLHYEDEIRKSDSYFAGIGKAKADKDMVEVAEALIDKKTAPFDADNYKDHYQAALRELISRKLKSKGKKVTTDVEPPEKRAEGSNVVDLMSALKKSLETGASAKPKSGTGSGSRRKAS